MICPQCQAEWVEGIATCPDCGTSLISKQDSEAREAAADRDVELVEVYRSSDQTLLPFVVSLLEQAGIPHAVQGENWMRVEPISVMNAVSYAQILVPKVREQEARELIADAEAGEITAEEVDEQAIEPQ